MNIYIAAVLRRPSSGVSLPSGGRATFKAGLALAALAVLLPLPTRADDTPSPKGTAARLQDRFYVSPVMSYTFTDGGRVTDNGYGGSLALGKQLSSELAVEVGGEYGRLDPAKLYAVGVNALFFPGGGSFYGLGGAAYGQLRSHPGNNADYGAVLVSLGAGWLWQPFSVLGNDVFLRTEALYRLDAHSDRRTGNSIDNGRKAFNDAVFKLGVLIPVGKRPVPVAQVADESTQVVPVEAAPNEAADPLPANAACDSGNGSDPRPESCAGGQ